MSRNITPKASAALAKEDAALRRAFRGKLIFTRYKGVVCALLIQNERLRAASFQEPSPNRLGAVYVGKIKNVVKSIDACFIEIADRELCFLPIKDASNPFLINRKYDGRLLEGDELLVQIERDAQKAKQAAVTTHVSLSNDCFALALGNTHIGYSAKLTPEQKESLKQLLTEKGISENGCLSRKPEKLLSPSDYAAFQQIKSRDFTKLPAMGLVVRTQAASQDSPEILLQRFFELNARFLDLIHSALHCSCFSCLKEASGFCGQIMDRLAAKDEYDEIITDEPDIYKQLTEHRLNAPNIRLYQDDALPLGSLYSMDTKLDTALNTRVWLKSGGYLVIEPTEALTVIDVNSGKYETKNGNNEAMALKINLEAAQEIMLQLRLRNLSGIIIADFINMSEESSQTKLMEYLKELAKRDRVRTTVVDITPLGLVEITRKKTSRPLHENYRLAMER